jgi:hypothetical protein
LFKLFRLLDNEDKEVVLESLPLKIIEFSLLQELSDGERLTPVSDCFLDSLWRGPDGFSMLKLTLLEIPLTEGFEGVFPDIDLKVAKLVVGAVVSSSLKLYSSRVSVTFFVFGADSKGFLLNHVFGETYCSKLGFIGELLGVFGDLSLERSLGPVDKGGANIPLLVDGVGEVIAFKRIGDWELRSSVKTIDQ